MVYAGKMAGDDEKMGDDLGRVGRRNWSENRTRTRTIDVEKAV